MAQEELQQGLGVSIKVTVIGEHIREPLIFTCDGKPEYTNFQHVQNNVKN